MEKDLIGKEKYFIHKGTWTNEYEWRIQKVKITGIKIGKDREMYVEFSFNCCGYEYPASYLKNTLKDAKKFAIQEINKEKKRQISTIKNYKE
jgi:hypothetical protein